MIRTTDFSPSRRDLLEEMSLQAEVLDRVSCLLLEKNDNISATDSKLPNLFLYTLRKKKTTELSCFVLLRFYTMCTDK